MIRAAIEDAGLGVSEVVPSGAEAIESVRRDPPDIALIDIGLPDQSGLVAGRAIRDVDPSVKVIMLTALEDPRLSKDAMRSRFHGYLSKDSPISQFVSTLRGVMNGRSFFPADAPTSSGSGDDIQLLARQLTNREREVLALLVEGLGGDEIARRLAVTGNTVRTHVQNILSKLQVHSRLEAATVAVRHGLVAGSRSRSARSHPNDVVGLRRRNRARDSSPP